MLKRFKQKVRLFLHGGNRYICPFCNYSSRDLAPIGIDSDVLKERQVIGAGRRPGGCYNCGSTDRERLVYVYLKERMRLFDADKDFSILHIAPENNLSKRIQESGIKNYECGDLFTEGYKYPELVKNIDLLSIPYADNSFDLIICNHVLEHIPDDRLAMSEISRVLKKGGEAILQVPISKNSERTVEDFSISNSAQREKVFGQFDHVRIYGQDYTRRLESSGFMVNKLNISREFELFGLNEEEVIFVCRKKD